VPLVEEVNMTTFNLWTELTKLLVWGKGAPIPNNDPAVWRCDAFLNIISAD
jgi:hypothetical protein